MNNWSIGLALSTLACSHAGAAGPPAEAPEKPLESLAAAPIARAEREPSPEEPAVTEPVGVGEPTSPGDAALAVDSTAVVQPAQENSGACLEPVSEAHELEPYDKFVRSALGFSRPGVLAAFIVSPSFRRPWMLSLNRGPGGRHLLRVTRLNKDVWAAMMNRMSEVHGGSFDLTPANQSNALADLSVEATSNERAVDKQTGQLFLALWRALIGRVQVVDSNAATLDGVSYYFWVDGGAGTTVSPKYGSILGRVRILADRLAQVVESPGANDLSDLAEIREGMRVALTRTLEKEACVQPYRP